MRPEIRTERPLEPILIRVPEPTPIRLAILALLGLLCGLLAGSN